VQCVMHHVCNTLHLEPLLSWLFVVCACANVHLCLVYVCGICCLFHCKAQVKQINHNLPVLVLLVGSVLSVMLWLLL